MHGIDVRLPLAASKAKFPGARQLYSVSIFGFLLGFTSTRLSNSVFTL
jgi:hypothetical protein